MPNIEKAKNQAGKTIFPVTVADAVLLGNGKTLKGELSELGSKVNEKFLELGTDNLFKDGVSGYVDGNGAIQDGSMFIRTNYIKVSKGDSLLVHVLQSVGNMSCVFGYDSLKKPVRNLLPSGEYNSSAIIIPDDIDYVIASSYMSYSPSLYILSGITRGLSLLDYGKEELLNIIKNFSLYSTAVISVTVENGILAMIVPKNTMLGLAGIKHQYKHYTEETTYTFPITDFSWGAVYIDYNAITNSFVGDFYLSSWATTGVMSKDDGIFAIPIIITDMASNIIYNVSLNNEFLNNRIAENDKNINAVSFETNHRIDKLIQSDNLFVQYSGYVKPDGSFENDGGGVFVRTDFIDVKGVYNLHLHIQPDVSGFPAVYGYDSDKQPLRTLLAHGTYDDYILPIPSDVYYIAAWSRKEYSPEIVIEGKVVNNLKSLEKEVESLNKEIDNIKEVPTTVLYNGIINPTDWSNTTICTISNNNAVINSVGRIALNRFYSIGRRVLRLYLTNFADSVFYIGCKAQDDGGWNTQDYKFNCPNMTMNIYNVDIQFNNVLLNNVDVYCVEVYKLNNVDSSYQKNDSDRVRIYNTRTLDEIVDYTVSLFGSQKDTPTIGIETGGVSPTICKVEVFSLVNKPYLYIVGDSITEGADTTVRYGDLIGKQLQKPYIISGRAGGTINGIIGSNSYEGKILTEIKYIRPNYVMVMIGTNGGGTSQQYIDLCNRIIALGCKVLLNNIPCHNKDGMEIANETNAIIEGVRNELGLNGVRMNIATSINNDGTNINSSLFNSGNNKIHPNALGNKAMYMRTFQDVPELYTDADIAPINTLPI